MTAAPASLGGAPHIALGDAVDDVLPLRGGQLAPLEFVQLEGLLDLVEGALYVLAPVHDR